MVNEGELLDSCMRSGEKRLRETITPQSFLKKNCNHVHAAPSLPRSNFSMKTLETMKKMDGGGLLKNFGPTNVGGERKALYKARILINVVGSGGDIYTD